MAVVIYQTAPSVANAASHNTPSVVYAAIKVVRRKKKNGGIEFSNLRLRQQVESFRHLVVEPPPRPRRKVVIPVKKGPYYDGYFFKYPPLTAVGISDPTPIKTGVVRAISRKQRKVRSIIPDTSELHSYVTEQISLAEYMPEYVPPTLREEYVVDQFAEKIFNRILDVIERNPTVENVESLIDIISSDEIHRLIYSVKPSFKYQLSHYISFVSQTARVQDILEIFKTFNILTQQAIDTPNKIRNNIRSKNSKTLMTLIKYATTTHNYRPSVVSEQIFENTFNLPGNINSACSKISSMSENISQTSTSINNCTNEFREQLDRIIDAMSSSTAKISQVKTFFDSVKENIINNMLSIPVVMYRIISANNIWSCLGDLSILLSLLGISKHIIEFIKDKYKKYTSVAEVREQSATFKLISVITIMLQKYIPAVGGSFKIFEIMREAKAFTELREYLEAVLDEWGIYTSPKLLEIKLVREKVAYLYSEYIEMEALFHSKPTRYLATKINNRFEDRLMRMRNVEAKFVRGGVLDYAGSTFIQEVKLLGSKYQSLFEAIRRVRDGSSVRTEPVALCFVGAPGCGKTIFAGEFITHTDTKESVLVKNLKSSGLDKQEIFEDMDIPNWTRWAENFQQGSDFADGYKGQEVHIADDVFQEAADSDHQRWINYISTTEFLTNQAALEDKGRRYLSKLIVSTCNHFPLSSKTIKDVTALQRRFSIVRCQKVPGVPMNLDDKTFPHLKFYFYQDGRDYVKDTTKTGGKLVTVDELALETLQLLKQKSIIYQKQTGSSTAEQLVTAKEVSWVEMEQLERLMNTSIVKLPQFWIDLGDNFGQGDDNLSEAADKIFKMLRKLKFKCELGNYVPLIELIRTEQKWKLSTYVMQHLTAVHPSSERFLYNAGGFSVLTKVSGKTFKYLYADRLYVATNTNCHNYFKDQQPENFDTPNFREFDTPHPDEHFGDCYANDEERKAAEEAEDAARQRAEDAEDTPTDPEDQHFREEFSRSRFERLSDFFKMLWEAIKRIGIKALESTKCVLSDLLAFVMSFSVSAIENIKFYFNMLIEQSYVYKGVVLGSVALIVFSVYKLYYVYNNKECNDCKNKVDQIKEYHVELSANYCKKFCWDGHTCDNFKNLLVRIERQFCNCDNTCDQCNHLASVCKDGDLEKYIQIIKLIDPRQVTEVKHLFNIIEVESDNPLLAKRSAFKFEDSSNSMTAKRRNMKFEDSSNSLTAKQRMMKFEDSSNSMKAKSRNMKFEDSSNSLSAKRRNMKFEGSDLFYGDDKFTVSEQVLTDEASAELTMKLIKECNPMLYRRKVGTDQAANLRGIGYGHTMITPAHFFVPGDFEYYFMRNDKEIFLTPIHIDRSKDVAITSFSNKENAFPMTAYNNLVNETELESSLARSSSCYLNVSYNGMYVMMQVNAAPVFQKRLIVERGDGRDEEVTYKELLTVSTFSHVGVPETRAGQCGGVLVMINPSAKRKLIGFHVLGGGQCLSAILTKEYVDKYSVCKVVPEILVEHCAAQEPNGDIDYLNLSPSIRDNPLYPAVPDIEYIGEYICRTVAGSNSKLMDHPFKGTFDIKVGRAPVNIEDVEDTSQLKLNAKGQPDILYTQLCKYSKTFAPVEGLEDDLAHMGRAISDLFIAEMQGEDLTEMTEEEALSGRLDYPDSEPLNMKTTAGEPWSRVGKTPGKQKNAYLKIRIEENGRKMYTIDRTTQHGKDLALAVERKDKFLKQGKRVMSIWKNCLKDETRPLEKCRLGKTRLFTAVPYETAILSRKYFGKFKEVWQSKRKDLFHSVGINPCSREWTHLAKYLSNKGEEFYDADYSAYDGSLRADFMMTAGAIVIRTINYVSGIDVDAAATLWGEYVETYQVSGSNIHLVKHGNPSGNPMTTVINCIVNFMYHWWCYRKITGKLNLNSFTNNVGFTCFGDDVVFSTNSKITGYSFTEVAKWMKVLGQDYTTAQKDSNDIGARKLSEITFLKRRFVLENGFYLCPIDKDSIEQQFNYTNIDANNSENIKDQIDNAMVEACQHGRDYFVYFREKIRSALFNNHHLRREIGLDLPNYSSVVEILIKRFDI